MEVVATGLDDGNIRLQLVMKMQAKRTRQLNATKPKNRLKVTDEPQVATK